MTIYQGRTAGYLVGELALLVGDPKLLRYEPDQLLRHLNNADVEFCRRSGCAEKDIDVTTAAGTPLYALPDDAVDVRKAFYDPTGLNRPLEPMPADAARSGDNWDDLRGLPTNYYVVGEPGFGWQIGFSPVPSTASVTIQVTYAYAPITGDTQHTTTETEMFALTSQPRTPPVYHSAVVDRAAGVILAAEGQSDRAAFLLEQFEARVEECNRARHLRARPVFRNARAPLRSG